MKTLNKQSTATFVKLLEMAKANEGHIKIDNTKGFFMPVCVEIIEETENLVKVSVAHYYEQNGDLMADPEMCFEAFSQKDNFFVMPYYFKQDSLGIEQQSIVYKDKKIHSVYPRMQSNHASFANMWMKNIKNQQKI